MNNLPIEIKRIIIKFIPRANSAQIIYDSKKYMALKYTRRFMFSNPLYVERIWEYLKPSSLKSIFYGGDSKIIIRNSISKGQYIALRKIFPPHLLTRVLQYEL